MKHLFMEGSECVCRNCGDRLQIGGNKLVMAPELAKTFQKYHENCKPRGESMKSYFFGEGV